MRLSTQSPSGRARFIWERSIIFNLVRSPYTDFVVVFREQAFRWICFDLLKIYDWQTYIGLPACVTFYFIRSSILEIVLIEFLKARKSWFRNAHLSSAMFDVNWERSLNSFEGGVESTKIHVLIKISRSFRHLFLLCNLVMWWIAERDNKSFLRDSPWPRFVT